MGSGKQSAAKTIAVLQERGYVARDGDPLSRFGRARICR